MQILTKAAEAFTGFFAYAGQTFIDNFVWLIPSVIVLLTLLNALTGFLGEERMDRFSRFCSRHRILSYTVLPIAAWFFLTLPANCTAAKYLPQRFRAGFVDATSTFQCPMVAFFPHTDPAEYYTWAGIALGVQKLGYSTTPLAIRLFLASLVLAIGRAWLTEIVWCWFAKREGVPIDG